MASPELYSLGLAAELLVTADGVKQLRGRPGRPINVSR